MFVFFHITANMKVLGGVFIYSGLLDDIAYVFFFRIVQVRAI